MGQFLASIKSHQAMFSYSAKRRSGQVVSKTSRRSTKKVVSASGMPRGVKSEAKTVSHAGNLHPAGVNQVVEDPVRVGAERMRFIVSGRCLQKLGKKRKPCSPGKS